MPLSRGQRVLLVDDLGLATGGTMAAAADLVTKLKGEITGFAFMVELAYLNGREKLVTKISLHYDIRRLREVHIVQLSTLFSDNL